MFSVRQGGLRGIKRSSPSTNLWSRLCHLLLTRRYFLILRFSVTDIHYLTEAKYLNSKILLKKTNESWHRLV